MYLSENELAIGTLETCFPFGCSPALRPKISAQQKRAHDREVPRVKIKLS